MYELPVKPYLFLCDNLTIFILNIDGAETAGAVYNINVS